MIQMFTNRMLSGLNVLAETSIVLESFFYSMTMFHKYFSCNNTDHCKDNSQLQLNHEAYLGKLTEN
jgi:hypothetical protein